jgi:Cu/Ag efflux protein CusF
MKRTILWSAAAVLLMTGTALAATTPITGTVRTIDPARKMVQLDNGERFYQGKGVQMMGLKPGTKVTFYYDMHNGQRTVESYAFAK